MYAECKFAPIRSCEEAFEKFVPALKDFYTKPADYREEPFRIFGNLYYVGDKKVCMHLVDTGDGLILFDTGYKHAGHMLLESIRALGFDPHDIKYIIHSHGHFDHFGPSNDMRKMFGCKVYMSRVDTELLRKNPDLALLHLGPMQFDEIAWPDVELDDGDVITLGNTSIRCVLAPGHTYGTMAFFFDVTDGSKTRRAGYYGGVGFLTMYRQYCLDMGLPVGKSEAMRQSILKLWDEPVDILLGNHPGQNCTLEKREWMLAHPEQNPFINPQAWHIFLSELEKKRQEFDAAGN